MNADIGERAATRDPLGRAVRVDIAGEFVPLGIRLRLETNSPSILEAYRTSFGGYGVAQRALKTPRFVIRLLVDPAFDEGPPWADPVFRSHDDFFYVCVGRQNTAIADLRRRLAIGFVAPGMAQDAGFLRKTFLECLTLTMVTHGTGATHTYVHASAVAMGGQGLLFSGPGESGKSTLAYACARRGFQVVTDDVVYLRDGRNGLIAWGRPWQLHFLSDCARFFPELKRRTESLLEANLDKLEIEVEEFLPDRLQVVCEPAAVFFLDRSGHSTTCEALNPREAVELLARDMIYDLPEVMEKHRRSWLQLAQRGSYVLRYGEDLDSVVDLLESFVCHGRPA